jgi:ectoine hydroxylase-related dioxygenase (phytanoyl-CoA dioxygenase family)
MDATFERDGFTVLRGALDTPLVDSLRALTDERLAREEREHFDRFRFHGSMLPLDALREEAARRLVLTQRTLAMLERLGLGGTRWLSGYIISKPPRSPALWWHQDWWAWDEPVSFDPVPTQVFVMYYLRDVTAANGALRVIPGSHRKPHPLHQGLPEAHSAEIADADESVRGAQPDEVTVEVNAGDAVIGDCRLLHATHPNGSDERRTCLTLWYLPHFDERPESIRSYLVQHPSLPPAGWWRDGGAGVPADLGALLPTYDGSAEPARYNRQPPAVWAS